MSENDETSPDLGAINTETGELPPEAPEAPILSSEEQLAEAPLFLQQGITELRAKKADLVAETAKKELSEKVRAENNATEKLFDKEKEIERQEKVSAILTSQLDREQAKLTEMKKNGASEAEIAAQQQVVTSTTIATTNSFAAGAKLEVQAKELADKLGTAQTDAADHFSPVTLRWT